MKAIFSPRARRTGAAHAFFLGALLALFALAPAIIPYGGRFVTRGDFIEQQLPFLLETRRILRGMQSYSFSTFLGAPAVGSYAFYTLGSPFVWPLALLPEALIPFGISVMAVLKHAVGALCAFLYLRRMIRDDRLALLGSVLYVFSSFTVVNTQFYHFTEVIAFFPLLLYGIEDAMGDHPRPGLLALCCGLNTLTNYYFMLGSALLCALYFVFRFFSADWQGARSLRRIVRTVFECGVGCALAGVLLLPALSYMLSITRAGASDIPLLAQRYTLSLLLERLRTLLMPIESGVVHAFYGDAGSWCSTACYLPAFGLTGALVLMMTRGRHGWLKGLLGALVLCSAVPALCGLFVLETEVGYTRWWYGLALMLTLGTLYALREHPLFPADDAPAAPQDRRLWLIAYGICAAAVCALVIPLLLPEDLLSLMGGAGQTLLSFRTGAYADGVFRALSLCLTLIGGFAMLMIILRAQRFALVLALTGFCAVCAYSGYISIGDASLLSGGTEAGSGVYTLEQIAEPTLGALSLPEPEGYTRIDYSPKLRNYGLLRGQSSLTCFTSLRTSTVGRFVSLAGLGFDEATTVTPTVKDPALYSLLSVTEYHQWPEDAALGDAVPEGFVYDREENGASVYVSDAAVPMGFLQTVCTGTHHQKMDAETIGDVLLAAAALSDEDLARYGERMKRLDVYAIPDWRESAARLRENACDRFETNGSGFTAHIDAQEAGLVIFTIPHDKGFTATVDGQRAEIVLCDVSFMGVWVEPGEHEIAFTYRTRYQAPGIAMSALAAVMLAGYVLLCRKAKRRKAT